MLDFRFSDPPRSTVAMKRAMDVVVSGLLLILLSPLLAAIALAILLDAGRPVFFRQRRAGKDGEPFTMLKFRTMVADAEQRLPELVDLEKLDQPAFKIPDDPRVTRSGRPCAAPASTSCRSCSTSCAARCRWSGRGPRRRASSPSTTSASAAAWRSSRG